LAFSTLSVTSLQTNLSEALRIKAPGRAGLGQNLEAVADAQHQRAFAGLSLDLAHDRRVRGHGAAAEIIAVENPPGTTMRSSLGSTVSRCQIINGERPMLWGERHRHVAVAVEPGENR